LIGIPDVACALLAGAEVDAAEADVVDAAAADVPLAAAVVADVDALSEPQATTIVGRASPATMEMAARSDDRELICLFLL
jgi:hypothetical protein